MARAVRQIEMEQALEREIAREAEERGTSWSIATTDLLQEAIRTRRAPGILFADGATGRRAVVAGSGLDVWEVVAAWQEGGRDLETLRADFPWLSEVQLRAALTYYELYPEEIDVRLAREREWTPERVRRELSSPLSRKPPGQR